MAARKTTKATDVEVVEKTTAEREHLEGLLDKATDLLRSASQQQGDGLADPEPDEDDEEIVFVRNGWIRCVIAGDKFKLRRPFMGELRDLETSMEADTEVLQEQQQAIQSQAEVALVRAREIGAQARELTDGTPEKMALDEEAASLAVQIARLSHEVVKKSYDLREAWWQQVFKTLTPPGQMVIEQMPSWVGDPALQARVVQHWRSVPLASGR